MLTKFCTYVIGPRISTSGNEKDKTHFNNVELENKGKGEGNIRKPHNGRSIVVKLNFRISSSVSRKKRESHKEKKGAQKSCG